MMTMAGSRHGKHNRWIATFDEHKQTFEHYATKLQMTYAMLLRDCENGTERRGEVGTATT